MKHTTFNKKRLAMALSLALGTGMSNYAYAQEAEAAEAASDDLEIINVTGIRGSLLRATDIKRENSGVVDAISAEDMGKFPDTNLAESLQRITGVTVSRTNGEGSQITVRGFGPSFNLVTLNGRQMPGTGNSRSYNFENLASEGVSQLEVYKTARAENPSGGLGATVNIVTARPFDSPGLKYAVSAKGIFDTSNVEGDDVTPQVAALFSNTFADDTFGVAFSIASQNRSLQQQSANVPGWQADQGPFNSATSFTDLRADTSDADLDTANGSDEDGKLGHTYFPRQISYNINNVERARVNGMLTLQYAPRDNMVATLDYVVSETETGTSGNGFGVWFNFGGNVTSYDLDENGTAVRFTEVNNDYAHSANVETLLVKSDSIAFNFDWQINDDINLQLDYHDSTESTDNGADDGTHHSGNVILAPNNIVTKTYDYTTGEIPNFAMTWPGGAAEANVADFDPLFAQFGRAEGESNIKQFQIDGEWLNPNDNALVKVEFGLARTEQAFGGYSANNGNQGPNGYNGNFDVFPDSMFTRQNTGDLLDSFAGGGSDLTTNYYYTFDYAEAIARMGANFSPFETEIGGLKELLGVTEETSSAYVSSELYYEVSDMPVTVNLGVRYEQTDTVSETRQKVEDFMVWSNPTEWQLRFTDSVSGLLTTTGEYDVILPNLDIKVDITDDLVGRLSAGKTISRPDLGALAGGRSLSPSPKPGNRTGGSGNTGLSPYESTNLDFSLEYYYEEGSYASIGLFRKDVKNWIDNTIDQITVGDLRDPFIGPRAIQAEADIVARGDQPTVTAIWEQIIANGGGVDDDCCQTQVVVQQADDPLTVWDVTRPGNGDTRAVNGAEVNVQHLFGESGFGASVNATFVNGDVEYDVNNVGGKQSVLPGLGDSANFQVFYEKDGLSAKMTYAWRDAYLIGVGQQQGSSDNPPQFAKAFGQVDMSINYEVNEELTVFFEAFNINDETEQGYGRYEEQFLFARQYGPRYTLGARYVFK